MNKNYSLREDGSFHIKDYNHTEPFSNFLPGIAGVWGIPLWAFYVNRAQGLISFGVNNKDNAILEFFPANKAYWLAGSCGFRTFLKIDNRDYYEPFRAISGYHKEEEMIIKSSSLEIKELNPHMGLNFSIKYFTIPNSPVGGLIRTVLIKNISKRKINLDILDGLPRIIPFGSADLFLKHLARTLEAWMHSAIHNNLATFRLIVDPKDVSQTKYIEGANFNYSFYTEKDKKVYPYLIADPDAIFGQDKSYSLPVKFLHKDFSIPLAQITCGKTPCAFSYFTWRLAPGEEKTFYSIFGSSSKEELIKNFVGKTNANFVKEKERENERVIEEIKNNALCSSGSQEFNNYIKCTYLDNVLRGGYPYTFDKEHTYYIFSRKHGDLERDYNKFKLLPSYFSEGEANYRDINQNRRIDLFFNPFIGRKNIIYFLNFIKIDGYNPLVVRGEKLFFNRKDALRILREFNIYDRRLLKLMEKGFYLGEFFKLLEEEGIKFRKKEKLAKSLIEKAERIPVASFGDGYWIDHWHYNLDLIENFLYFYPDRLKELFLSKEHMFWDDEVRVKERKQRYHLKDNKIYQWQSVENDVTKEQKIKRRLKCKNFLRTEDGKIYKTDLITKLMGLVLNKASTLDPEGIGIEMEADKPGWCDSLNGLPALFGSSLCETLELKRACLILLNNLEGLRQQGISRINFPVEIYSFFNRLNKLLKAYLASKKIKRDFLWWDKANLIKEDFRKQTFFFLRGKERKVSLDNLVNFLNNLIRKLDIGIEKAKDKSSKLYFTYFRYEVSKFAKKDNHIVPLEFIKKPLPLFLEGPVHVLKVENNENLYFSLRKSELFDKKISMYRLNATLKKEPLEIGRSRVFVPGWLENESIWLHMEYKYLLEVLKNGLYKEFFDDFYKACVCFFEPGSYGRNILENSSFIVSSVYPDKSLWGRGFIARLSGATVELLNIWILMCLGKNPFFIDKDKGLCIRFSPLLNKAMFTTKPAAINFKGREIIIGKNSFAFKLFSSTLVVYHNPGRVDTFKKSCKIKNIIVEMDGARHIISSDTIRFPLSYAIREAKVDRIDIHFE